MFFSIFPKDIETAKLCGDFSEGASLMHPSIIEKTYDNKRYVISYDCIVRECLVFDKTDNLVDGFVTIFTEQKYKGKLFREYLGYEKI